MIIDDNIRNEKLQYEYQVKLINMYILQTKKYYFPIKVKLWNELSLLIFFSESFRKTSKTN